MERDRLNQMTQLDKERLQRLEEEVEDITESLRNEEDRVIELEQEVCRHRGNSEKLSRVSELEEIIQQKNNLLTRQRSQLGESAEKVISLTSEVTQRNNFINELNSRIKDEKTDQQAMALELESMKSELFIITNSKERLEDEYKRLSENISESAINSAQQVKDQQQEIRTKETQIRDLKERLQDVELEFEAQTKTVKSLKLENTSLEKGAKKMTKDLKLVKEAIETDQGFRTKNEQDSKQKASELRKRVNELESKLSDQEASYKQENLRMMELHKQALELFREENSEIDQKYTKELERRRQDQERQRATEARYREELDQLQKTLSAVTKSKSKKSSKRKPNSFKKKLHIKGANILQSQFEEATFGRQGGDPSLQTFDDNISETGSEISITSMMDEEMRQRDHQIVDLNAELDKYQRENYSIRNELNSTKLRSNQLEESHLILKRRNEELSKKTRELQTLTSIAEKDDLEVVRELNNLREKVLDLKAERNRIVEQLRSDSGGNIELGNQQEQELSAEAMITYIKKLIEDKILLGEEVQDREEKLGSLHHQIDKTEECNKFLRQESDNLKEELDKRDIRLETQEAQLERRNEELSKVTEHLTRRDELAELDQTQREVEFRQLSIERDLLLSKVTSLSKEMKIIEEDNKEGLKLQECLAESQQRMFVSAVAQIHQGVRDSRREGDEVIKDLLAKFLANSTVISNKEAKMRQLEEKNKKLSSKKKQLSKEVKSLKSILGQSLLTLSKNTKKPQTAQKAAIDVAHLIENVLAGTGKLNDLTLTGKKLSKMLSSIEKPSNQKSMPEVDVLQAELSSKKVKIRKQTKEICLLNQKLQENEMDLQLKTKEIISVHKENKSLSKSLDKAAELYQKEAAKLVKKITGHKELNELRDQKEEFEEGFIDISNKLSICELEIKKQKDSIDCLRLMKNTLEKKLKKEISAKVNLEEKVEKLESKSKKVTRTNQNLKEFKNKYEIFKKENEKLKNEKESKEQKISIMKMDLTRKDNLLGQLKEKVKISEVKKGELIDQEDEIMTKDSQVILNLLIILDKEIES